MRNVKHLPEQHWGTRRPPTSTQQHWTWGWLGYEGFEKAAMIYRALAYSGYPVAMYNYGNMLAHGRGVKKNIKRAVYWYGKAADQWLVVAMCAKAMFLTYGPEDARDYKTAFELFLRAAESGDETAMYQLGCFYMKVGYGLGSA